MYFNVPIDTEGSTWHVGHSGGLKLFARFCQLLCLHSINVALQAGMSTFSIHVQQLCSSRLSECTLEQEPCVLADLTDVQLDTVPIMSL